MHELIKSKRSEIVRLCLEYKVQSLSLFGSATRDDFDPERSDLDFLVEFQPQERRGFNDVYFKLLEELEALFEREIDLVERRAVEQSRNYIRRKHILSSARPLYAA